MICNVDVNVVVIRLHLTNTCYSYFWQILCAPKKQTYMYSICVYEFFARHWMLYHYFKAHNIKILVHRENICACKLVYHLRLFHCLLLFQYCISFKLHKRVYTPKKKQIQNVEHNKTKSVQCLYILTIEFNKNTAVQKSYNDWEKTKMGNKLKLIVKHQL